MMHDKKKNLEDKILERSGATRLQELKLRSDLTAMVESLKILVEKCDLQNQNNLYRIAELGCKINQECQKYL